MIKICKKIVCAVLTACMVLPLFVSVGVSADQTNESMFENSVIVRVKSDFYVKNGKKVYYQKQGGYYPQFTGDDFRISGNILRNMLGVSYRYDSKTETANISANGRTFTIRVGEDGYTADGVLKYIEKKDNRMAIGSSSSNQLLPLLTVARNLGYNVIQKNSMYVITKLPESMATNEFYDSVYKLFVSNDILIDDEFTDPITWTYSTWNGGSAETKVSANEPTAYDSNAAYIGSTKKGFIGLMSTKTYLYDRSKNYRIIARVKTTSDYADQQFIINAWMKDSQGKFLGSATFETTEQILADEWKTYEFNFMKYAIRDPKYDDVAEFQILLRSSNAGEKAAGGIWIDYLILEETEIPNEYVSSDIIADKYAAWYNIGDTVTYTMPNSKPISNFKKINVRVYNGDNEKIFTDSLSKDSFVSKGWSYTPEGPGYYEVEFDAVSQDGFSVPIVTSYLGKLGTKDGNALVPGMNLKRRSFAVVDGPAKPMEERNSKLMLSVHGTGRELEFKLGDMVGMSGVRIHAMRWGSGYGTEGQGIEDTEGVYNFTTADNPVNLAEKYNYKTVMANLFSTPKWAVEEKYQNITAVSYNYMYTKMAPRDMMYLDRFIKEFYKHYKGRVDILEFMNEPHYGNTAFYADTPENLSKMIQTAYNALREVDPKGEMKFATASFNQGYQLFDELIADPELYDSFDYFTFHSGTGSDLKTYKKSAEKFNYEFKPAFATEEYLYSKYYPEKPKDHRMNSMEYMIKMLSHLKAGVEGVAQFEMTDNIPDEVRVWQTKNDISSSHVMGLFSPFPYLEPHKGAVVAYNFSKIIGLDFEYDSEYDFGNGTKGIRFENDGKPMMFIWNSKDDSFELSDNLKSAITDSSKLIDFEGRQFDANDTLKPLVMYILTDLDREVLDDKLTATEDCALNDSFEAPFYTCTLPEFEEIEPVLPEDESKIVDNNPSKIFDEKTFKLSDDINWTTLNWNWVGDLKKPEGYMSKFAAHVDKDGLYLLVDTTDSVIYTPDDGGAPAVDNMWGYDSVQFAVDCLGTGNASKRAEFQVGIYEGKPTLFKHVAPEIDFNMVSNWSRTATVLDEKYVRIEKTDHGQLYKIFVPMSELFPFQYSNSSEFMRFSVLVNNNDGAGRCYNEWTSGIGGSKDPKLFGAIRFK